MMTIWRDWFPDEWRSAWSSAKRIKNLVNQTSHARTKILASVFLPLVIGSVIAILVSPTFTDGFVRAVMTVIAILAGFVMNMILTTGKTDMFQYLDLNEAIKIRDKLKFLIWSQIMTLTIYFLTEVFAVIWFYVKGGDGLFEQTIAVLFVGGIVASLFRSLLLPYQIYEVHDFALDATIKHKQEELKNNLDREIEDLDK